MSDPLSFLAGGGEASRMIRERDWTGHPLGGPEVWPGELKAALSLILNSPESMILAWGPELSFFFNETYFPLLGPRLPWAMGERFDKVWADAWDQAKPIIDAAFEGRSERFVDLPWKLGEDRGARDTWWTFSYSRVLDAEGGVAGLFIFTNETTARVLADAALKESQGRLEAALGELSELNASLVTQVAERTADRNALWQLTPDLMLRGSFDGLMTAVNPAWTERLGWREEELLGKNLFDLVHPDDRVDTIAGAQELSKGRGHARFDNRCRHKDGSYRWISWSTGPGEGVINAIGRDVTQDKKRAEELEQAQEALRQSQKMEAVGQLTGGIAHDFNNLLAGIVGSLEILARRIDQGRINDVERYITAAQGATSRAAALTHRLLAFSRRQTLDPKPTDLQQLVSGMEDLIRRTVGPAIRTEFKAAQGLWPTRVDPPQLESALLNLCINARDAMPDGGDLIVEASNRTLDDRAARVFDLPLGEYVSLTVRDTGTGMSPDVIEKAFDPFFTTKPIGQGTGLGLSMVYGFARQSGGQVRIHSVVGQGTAIGIYLPRLKGELDARSATGNTEQVSLAAAGETVLVVDDEPTVRMLVVEVLEELGYAAIEAGDGPSGLRLLESDLRIDLLITDVGLPGGMNGRQLADAARLRRNGLKVLFITGYAETAAVGEGNLEPGMSVMTKPFAMDALAGRIRELISERS